MTAGGGVGWWYWLLIYGTVFGTWNYWLYRVCLMCKIIYIKKNDSPFRSGNRSGTRASSHHKSNNDFFFFSKGRKFMLQTI